MRLFLALELPDDILDLFARMQERLRSRISSASFISRKKLHLTLRFLGETDEAKRLLLVQSLAQVRTGSAIRLIADRVECFPDRGSVRIVAAAFRGDVHVLTTMYRTIEERCRTLGFKSERREYCPHATLARAIPSLPESVRTPIAETLAGQFPSPEFQIREFVLMQSHLTHEGSRYEVLDRFPLMATG